MGVGWGMGVGGPGAAGKLENLGKAGECVGWAGPWMNVLLRVKGPGVKQSHGGPTPMARCSEHAETGHAKGKHDRCDGASFGNFFLGCHVPLAAGWGNSSLETFYKAVGGTIGAVSILEGF